MNMLCLLVEIRPTLRLRQVRRDGRQHTSSTTIVVETYQPVLERILVETTYLEHQKYVTVCLFVVVSCIARVGGH